MSTASRMTAIEETRRAVGLPAGARVVAAMSGGVDSSVTAALLVEAGYEVIGITLQLYDQGEALRRKGACCAGQDIYDAARVAERVGIPHYVLDYESRFAESVMADFANTYLAGATPIPCVRCNQTVKFRDLLATAGDLGAEALATGHYVRREAGDDGEIRLLRAKDPAKDQSYFLFATTDDQLRRLRFPLGGLAKAETRAHAERLGLPVAEKPESMDICFVPDGDYARVVERLRPGAAEPGEIVHLDGRVLGRHTGIIHYTIGQRRGLGIGGRRDDAGEALYVVRLDPARRRVIVGPREALGRDLIHVREVNWLGEPCSRELAIEVKLRSAQAPMPARLSLGRDGTGLVTLARPHRGVAPGQASVFYEGDRVLGGGWITGTELSRDDAAAA